jgi:hypothetical protein
LQKAENWIPAFAGMTKGEVVGLLGDVPETVLHISARRKTTMLLGGGVKGRDGALG